MGGVGHLEKPEEESRALLIICSYNFFFSGKLFVMGGVGHLKKPEQEIQRISVTIPAGVHLCPFRISHHGVCASFTDVFLRESICSAMGGRGDLEKPEEEVHALLALQFHGPEEGICCPLTLMGFSGKSFVATNGFPQENLGVGGRPRETGRGDPRPPHHLQLQMVFLRKSVCDGVGERPRESGRGDPSPLGSPRPAQREHHVIKMSYSYLRTYHLYMYSI